MKRLRWILAAPFYMAAAGSLMLMAVCLGLGERIAGDPLADELLGWPDPKQVEA
jgi:hypothetical protein